MKLGKIIAHRGLTGSFAPRDEQVGAENTLTAFRHALLLGVNEIELDIQMTKDRQLVVIHDEDLSRTTNGKGKVKDYTFDQLQSFDIKQADGTIKKDEKIPLYSQVLEMFAQEKKQKKGLPTLNTELKTKLYPYDGIERQALKLADHYGLQKDIYYSSFCHRSLEIVRDLNNQIGYHAQTAMLYYHDHRSPSFPRDFSITSVRSIGATAIHANILSFLHPQTGHLEDQWIRSLQRQSFNVRCYTVNDPSIADPLLRLGVDIITNDPHRMIKLKQEMLKLR